MFKLLIFYFSITCVLLPGQVALALASGSSGVQDGAQQQETGSQQAPHAVEGRVTINPVVQEMTLAQPNAVPLDLHGFAPAKINAVWRPAEPGIEGLQVSDPEPLSIEHASDNSTYVNIVPTRLGKFQLSIVVDFSDGGVDDGRINVDVDHLPAMPPVRLILSDPTVRVDFTRKAGTIHMDLSSAFNTEHVVAVAFYGSVKGPIPLTPLPGPTEQDLAFALIARHNQAPPIVFDPQTGVIKAIRPGQVLIRAVLQNKSAYACVDVTRDAREFNQRSNCNDFLPPGTGPIEEPLQLPEPVKPRSR